MRKLRLKMAPILLAGGFAVTGVAETTVYSDTFSDGARNKALWRVDASLNGAFVERNGRLYGYSGTREPLDAFHAISWIQKPVINLGSQDTLEVEATLRVAWLEFSPALPPYPEYGLRFGFSVPGPSTRGVYLRFFRYSGGRAVQLAVNRPDHSTIAYGIWLADDRPKYQFKLRYQTATGKLSVWSRATSGEAWTRRKTVNLNAHWQMSAGASVAVQPYLMFASYNVLVESTNALYFDNYKAVHKR